MRRSQREKLLKRIGLSGLAALAAAAVGLGAYALVSEPAPTSHPAPSWTYTAPAFAEAKQLVGIAEALQDGSKPLVIAVLGDSTGNAPDEWVGLMSQGLAAETNRRVSFINFNPQVSAYAAPRVYGPESEPVTIYNVGIPGATTAEIAARFEGLVPQAPQLVITSVGHNQLPDEAGNDMTMFTDAIKAKWPESQTFVVQQNPALDARALRQEKTVAKIRTWAVHYGFPTVDVYSAIAAQPDYSNLYADLLHVNDAGSKVWAGVVRAALLSNGTTPAAG